MIKFIKCHRVSNTNLLNAVLFSPLLDLIIIKIFPALFLLILITGCVSEKVNDQGFISTYQETMVARGPQERTGTEGLEPISPAPDPRLPGLKEIKGISGRKTINLKLDDAVVRALASSPIITAVSFDPSTAKESIAVAVSEFDVTAFGQLEYDNNDSPSNDITLSGQSQSGFWEAGIKQKGVAGSEWSLSYTLTRSVDETITRIFPTSYEPTMTFKLKQPLLRDAWSHTNLAGVNISKLNYRIALAAFRQKTEDVITQVISLYWTLFQARRDVEIQQRLLDKTIKTLRKVEDRKNIDATMGDIKQAEASVKSRQATLFEAEKRLFDVQDELIRLLADNQLNLIDDLEIVPTTAPNTGAPELDQSELLKLALRNNPDILRAQLEVDVAEINVKVAKRQKMPRLDMFASTELKGLSDAQREAHDMVFDRDFIDYTLGVTLEYPLGNREKKAEFRLRKLKHSKARSNLQNVSDKVATLVKGRMRFAETSHKEIQVQKDAFNAARIHLQSLEDIEVAREKLTPEFLLAKIQAQASLADAQRAEIRAIVNYNIALTRLAQAIGKVLDMRSVQSALPMITSRDKKKLTIAVDDAENNKPMPKESNNSWQAQEITEETEQLTEK
jgi:outer membrane protein